MFCILNAVYKICDDLCNSLSISTTTIITMHRTKIN